MKIRKKLLLVICLLTIFVLVINYSIQKLVVFPSFVYLEESAAKDNIKRSTEAIQREIDHLDLLCFDWSAWDDTYDFIESQSEEYISSNLLLSTFSGTKLNLLYFYDTKGMVVWKGIHDIDTLEKIDIGDAIDNPTTQRFLLDTPRDNSQLQNFSRSGIIKTKHGPLLLAARPIITSNFKGPSRGTLIMGRFLNQDLIELLIEQTQVDFTVKHLQTNQDIKDNDHILSNLSLENKFHIVNGNSENITVHSAFLDVAKKPALLISGIFSKDISKRGMTSITIALACIFAAGICSLLLFWVLARSIVLNPLSLLTSLTQKVETSNDLTVRSSLDKQDEFGILSNGFNRMMDKLETQTNELSQALTNLRAEINERKRVEEIMIHAERLSAVGTLAAGVAHEFNNINTAVLGFANIGESIGDLPDDANECFTRITKASLRAKKITQNLLTFTKTTSSKIGAGDLQSVVKETLGIIAYDIKSTGVTVIEELQPTPYSKMDPNMIGQVVLNLIINAHHSTIGCTNKSITVTCGKTGDCLFVKVEDTGCGMDAETKKQIFTPFFSTKGEKSISSGPQNALHGTGLGLSICHTIIANHRGKIDCESTLGKGTSFTVKIPYSAAEDTEDEKIDGSANDKSSISGSILVLDDDADICDMISILFRHSPIEVQAVDDGNAALKICASNDIDIILLDLQMPTMDGFEFATTLRKRTDIKQPVIIVISGKTFTLSEGEMTAADISEIINKPFEVAELKQCIIHHLMSARD